MILYGRRGQSAATGLKGGLCGNCNNEVQFAYSINNNYAHIFFIPTFPIGKSVALVCPVCKTVSHDHEIAAPFKNELKALHKEKTKTPIYHYMGLFLIAAFALNMYYTSGEEKKLTQQYLGSPKAGDLYEVKLKNKSYTVYKLREVRNDSLSFIPSLYQSSTQSGLIDLEAKGDSAFDNSNTYKLIQMVLLKEDAHQMLEKGDLLKIKRVN